MDLPETQIDCPYCWQSMTILLDPSIAMQDYVEDCQVCCQPIQIRYQIAENGDVEWVEATRENE